MPRMRNETDKLMIRVGSNRIVFKKQCKLSRTVNDLLVGILFVGGSLFNLSYFGITLGTLLYLAGSVILVSRSVANVLENISVVHEVKDTEHQEWYH
ncbi:YrhK family protein [Evansella sp. LMS18]|uniref:YrhK family protein n=1 Tax=Evansella sp. LMS18 TaxID=2924033 RepID=UPI0020D0F393|nr:YrhK family protein [Evansella sp. LMS18]UTR10380.1 YrhK family protein [Evansella sp. LMS18]